MRSRASEPNLAVSDAILEQRSSGRLAVITEIKTQRHDGLDLLRGRDAGAIAAAYARGGAAAISVVTGRWFGGEIDLLDAIAAQDLGLPILRKDFIRNKNAIRESKDRGASAVLLTRQILDAKRFSELVAYARDLSIEPFVEVATDKELKDVLATYDGLIAINNANIGTRESTGAGIERSLDLRTGDDDRIWVSASKITGPHDIGRLAQGGFDGVLVGTHLMLADDPESATAALVAAGHRL